MPAEQPSPKSTTKKLWINLEKLLKSLTARTLDRLTPESLRLLWRLLEWKLRSKTSGTFTQNSEKRSKKVSILTNFWEWWQTAWYSIFYLGPKRLQRWNLQSLQTVWRGQPEQDNLQKPEKNRLWSRIKDSWRIVKINDGRSRQRRGWNVELWIILPNYAKTWRPLRRFRFGRWMIWR